MTDNNGMVRVVGKNVEILKNDFVNAVDPFVKVYSYLKMPEDNLGNIINLHDFCS